MQKIKINLLVLILMVVALVTSVIGNLLAFKIFKTLNGAMDTVLNSLGDILKDLEQKKTKPGQDPDVGVEESIASKRTRERVKHYMDSKKPINAGGLRHNLAISFGTREEVYQILDECYEQIDEHGVLTISDLYELCGMVSTFNDTLYGWTSSQGFMAMNRTTKWELKMPLAVRVGETNG